VSAGQLTIGDFADAQQRASQAAILEQEIAGIEIIAARRCTSVPTTGTSRVVGSDETEASL
jgi:hypothetical protein